MGEMRGTRGTAVRGDLVGAKGTSSTPWFQSWDSHRAWGAGGWAVTWHFAPGPQFPQAMGCACCRVFALGFLKTRALQSGEPGAAPRELGSVSPRGERGTVRRHRLLEGGLCKTCCHSSRQRSGWALRPRNPLVLTQVSSAGCKGTLSSSCALGTCAGLAFPLLCPSASMLSAQGRLCGASRAPLPPGWVGASPNTRTDPGGHLQFPDAGRKRQDLYSSSCWGEKFAHAPTGDEDAVNSLLGLPGCPRRVCTRREQRNRAAAACTELQVSQSP